MPDTGGNHDDVPGAEARALVPDFGKDFAFENQEHLIALLVCFLGVAARLAGLQIHHRCLTALRRFQNLEPRFRVGQMREKHCVEIVNRNVRERIRLPGGGN
jgi:hypothetical protein